MNATDALREAMRDWNCACSDVTLPYTWLEDDGAYFARYRCESCGKEWDCWWAKNVQELKEAL